jgi:pyridoxine/pyridoxamine 5'-phosphate oxidase
MTATDTGARQSEFDCPPADPFALFRTWVSDAVEHGLPEATALVSALATASAAGRASNRIVRFLALDDRGLVFTSYRASQKGQELAETGWASAVLWWPQVSEQVIVGGAVQAMSASSVQGAPLAGEESLRAAARRRTEAGQPLPRPGGWLAYRLVPSSVEFWRSSADGLHRRLRYDSVAGRWAARRLQP